MKRFALVALLAAMLFSLASTVSATELKVKGSFEAAGEWSANLYDFDSDEGDADNQYIGQRMRIYFTYVSNENLKAVLGLEMDNIWGKGDSDWGTDVDAGGTNPDQGIEIKHAYLDFNFPNTAINVKAGMQYVALPSVFGNPVFDEDAPALLVSTPINDMFGVTVGFTRGSDDASLNSGLAEDGDEIDAAMIVLPVTLDGFSVTPYFAYAWVGATASSAGTDDVVTGGELAGFGDDATVWAVGANAELTMFDPLTFAADLIYGAAELDDEDYETKGWYAALAGSYKFDMLTATLFSTYGTGADEDADEDDFLPALAEGWGVTPFLGGVRAFSFSDDSYQTAFGQGLWTVGLKLGGIKFVENLSHDLTIAYAEGTSDEDAGVDFDEEDSAWEVYMMNKYMIYENLAAINELGYYAPDYDDDNREDDAAYFATVGFQYKF